MEKLTDINEVCRLLNTTSRTLRFYESKGIIQSTKNRFSNRRKYSDSQIQQIKNVLVLRTLGISVKTISELQKNDFDLKTAVLSKKAEIIASIDTKIKEINLLNEAIGLIEAGKDIFNNNLSTAPSDAAEIYKEIVVTCTQGIINRDYTPLELYFSETMKRYLPENVFWSMWDDTTKVCGRFISLDNCFADHKNPNIIYQNLGYEKLGVRLKFVFFGNEINGLWSSYYEL